MNLFEPNTGATVQPKKTPNVQAQSEPGSGIFAEPDKSSGKPSTTDQPTDQLKEFNQNIWMLLGAGIAAFLIFSKRRKK